jgi:hypothetical protein
MAMYLKNAIGLIFAEKPKWFEDYQGLKLGTLCGFKQAYGINRSYRHAESSSTPTLTDNWAVLLKGV